MHITYNAQGRTGFYFEVEVEGNLVHSKMGGGGFPDTDAKMEKIIQAVKEAACCELALLKFLNFLF